VREWKRRKQFREDAEVAQNQLLALYANKTTA
jgi:hypothetical protein